MSMNCPNVFTQSQDATSRYDAVMAGLRETQHQFRRPFVLDSTAARETFGLEPTPIEDAVRIDLAAGEPTGVKA